MEIECPAPGCGYKTPAIEATAAIQLLQMHNNTNHMATCTASTSAAASSVPNISVIVVNQNTNTNVNHILVKNQVMKLGFDKEEDAQKFLNFLGEDSPDRTERLQKFVRLTEDKRLRLPSVNTLTRSVCLIRYRGASGKWHGTGFLAKVPGNGVALLSAGHNFEHKKKLIEEFENFTFLFDHTDGVLYPKTSTRNAKNMKELMSQFNCDVIITFEGQQLIKKNGKPPIIRPHKNVDLDYFILHFTNADAEEKLRSHNLDFLEIDPGKDRKPKGEPVYIFGYPRGKSCLCCKTSSKCKCRRMPTGSQCSCKEGCICDEEPGTCTCTAPCHHPTELCQCQHPLRFSHGSLKQKEGEVRMKYDMDTEEGNSGSPISGAEYTVEGIHVSTSGNLNTAQSIKPVLEDLQTILDGDCDTSQKTSKSKGFLSGLFFQEKCNLEANESIAEALVVTTTTTTAEGYFTNDDAFYGPISRKEYLKITFKNGKWQGLKIVGDANVPRGKVSFQTVGTLSSHDDIREETTAQIQVRSETFSSMAFSWMGGAPVRYYAFSWMGGASVRYDASLDKWLIVTPFHSSYFSRVHETQALTAARNPDHP